MRNHGTGREAGTGSLELTGLTPGTPIRRGSRSLLLGVAPILVLALGCGDVPPTEPPLPTATTIEVSPSRAMLQALGDTTRFTATVLDQNGQVMAGAAVAFSSSDVTVATVDASGLATAVGNGSATLTVTSGSATGSALITVAQVVAEVEVLSTADTLVHPDTTRLAAQAADANGHPMPGVEFAWSSTDTTVALVDSLGLATSVAPGETELTATSSGVSGSAALVVVAPAPTTVTVIPDTAALRALGDTIRLSAEVFDQVRRPMEGEAVAWESGDTLVAAVDSTGLSMAVGEGSTIITARAGSASGTTTVLVSQAIDTIRVLPSADTLVHPDTTRLTAQATDANGHPIRGLEFTWSSGDTSVALVDSLGLVTTVAPGETELRATSSGVSGSAAVLVVAPVPTAVTVTPNNPVLRSLGDTVRLSAEVFDQAGRPLGGEAVAWESGDTLVARVDAHGLVAAVGNGSTVITARVGSASGSAMVTIRLSIASVVVSPSADTIVPGETLHLVAQALDDTGRVITGMQFTWSTKDPAVAVVDATGLVRGVGKGTTTVSAASGNAEGTARITVIRSDRAALVAFHEATNGSRWTRDDNWLTDAPLEEWYGVNTDSDGRVVELSLYTSGNIGGITGVGLTGSIPPLLGNLDRLRVLNLSLNDLTGQIPPELGNLRSLEKLELSSNDLEGPIPPELGNLTGLKRLELNHNRLSGGIPPGLGDLTELDFLWLAGNQLEGPIPVELGRLTELTVLRLYGNRLTGPMPPELGNLTQLRSLALYDNRLTGPIPVSLSRLSGLEWISINDNSGLCVPGTTNFEWFNSIARSEGSWCNAADLAVLESFYASAGGNTWDLNDGWLNGTFPGRWHGIETDFMGRVVELDLSNNGLAGEVSRLLGELAHLRVLKLGGNADLAGSLPTTLARLSLQVLDYAGTGICVPGEPSFQGWLARVPTHGGTGVQCESLSERKALELFHDATGGPDWNRRDNWRTDAPLAEWEGVEVDGHGRVTGLKLARNRLTGPIPPELSSLTHLEELDLGLNELTGPIPPDLGSLTHLRELELGLNELTGPIPAELANLTELRALNLYNNKLTGPIPVVLGSLPHLGVLQLGANRLTGEIPRELGGVTSLWLLGLSNNQLTGHIPPELGELASLWLLGLGDNQLTGRIPPGLGHLSSLAVLNLANNDLTGPIPPELGRLTRMANLSVANNDLTGPIPPELGRLTRMEHLQLDGNHFEDSIPLEFGNFVDIETLNLGNNQLRGPIPPELGTLSGLIFLEVSHNPDMSGALPASLTALTELKSFHAVNTGLCVPSDPAVQSWLDRIRDQVMPRCAVSVAYLTQAVQSRAYPVPLVAGEDALLRVFVTAEEPGDAHLPPVRARFYLNGAEAHVAEIPAKTHGIPPNMEEGILDTSLNARIPGRVVQPGLEMAIEVDPEGTVPTALGIVRRIPAEGRLSVEVHALPLLDLTVIPFLWSEDPDSAIVTLVQGMADDPQGHELLRQTVDLLPVGDLEVTAHAPVLTDTKDKSRLLDQTAAIRAMEGNTGHYMGTMSGVNLGGRARGSTISYADPRAAVIAHELGHNFGLPHAPCGGAGGLDPWFPHPRGRIDAWGYANREVRWQEGRGSFAEGQLVSPRFPDLMSYCGPEWISAYNFAKALRFRVQKEATAARTAAPRSRSLLIWGGVDSTGTPYLEPAFVVHAPASRPAAGSEYGLTGRDSDGNMLFSLNFDMPLVADGGEGAGSFAYVLPIRPEWDERLATIALSGAGGTATLDGATNRPMTIHRDSANGQVRGILRGSDTQAFAAAETFLSPRIEVLFSRGVPSLRPQL